MKNLLVNLVEKNKKYTDEGKVASYIPALLKANKDDLGLCVYDIKNIGLEKVMLNLQYKVFQRLLA